VRELKRVRLIHWNAAEAAALRDKLQAAGHTVDYTEKLSSAGFSAIRQSPPDAFVIDLSRLPSHGREVATFIRGQKTIRHIPIVFTDGESEKVEAIRKLLPDALYTPRNHLQSALRRALAHPPANPVVPVQMMERYTARSAAQKLGIREGFKVALIDPPRDYASAIGELPSGAEFEEIPSSACQLTLYFVHNPASCAGALPAMRHLAAKTKLWILWRKSSGVTQPFLRKSSAAVGLVDYKICSVNNTWSAMLFARKKVARKKV
jgi:CheY-like chemotaxis protein